jgi:hypothetical protein
MTASNPRRGCCATLALTVALAWTPFAVAAPQPPNASAGRTLAIQRLADCRKVADSVARLACYDEAAAAIDQAEASGDIVVVDREQARKVRRQAFGFTLPSISLFQRGEKPEEIDRVSLPVQSATRGPDGKWIIRFEGQVWRQIDTGDLSRDPRPGEQATIRKASMGSYLMSVGGHAAIRVKRDN